MHRAIQLVLIIAALLVSGCALNIPNIKAKAEAGNTQSQCSVPFKKSDSELFGSPEQLRLLQKKVKENKCSQLKIAWQLKGLLGLPVDKIILLDLDESSTMLRWTKFSTQKPSHELWYGFSRNDFLEDDPNDGFDLPNYTTTLSSAEAEMMRELVTKMTAP